MRNRIAILIGCGIFVLFTGVGFAADNLSLSELDKSQDLSKLKNISTKRSTSKKNGRSVKKFEKLLFGDLDEGVEELEALPSSAKLKRITKNDFIKKASSKNTKTALKTKSRKKKRSSIVQANFKDTNGKKKSSIIQVRGPETKTPFSMPVDLLAEDSEETEEAEETEKVTSVEDDESLPILLLPENEKEENEQETSTEDVFVIGEEPGTLEVPEEPVMVKKSDISTEKLSFPTAETGIQNPSVSLQWVNQAAVNVGQECECELIVKNSGKTVVQKVAVDAFFPKTLRISSVSPRPEDHNDHLTWTFDTLNPGQEERIHLKVIPSAKGNLETTAFVRFTGAASSAFVVREPLLSLKINGPLKAIVGELASQVIVVSNKGDGVASDVIVQAIIPDGLQHSRGKKLTLELGSLEPGETRNIRLSLEAIEGGDQKIIVRAKANSVTPRIVESTISVDAPHLQVAVEGPGLRYVGRKAQYRVKIENDGQGVSNNVRIQYQVPAGFEYIRSDRGGKFDKASKTVQWFVGRLEAAETRQVRIELLAKTPGEFAHQIAVVSENGDRAKTELETNIEGSASLVLEIIDLDDPVEVGSETAYEVRIKNEGSAVANNVALKCELPEGVHLLSAKGPTQFKVDEGNITFNTVSELEPGKTAIFRVHIKGNEAGDKRFRVNLASDSIDEPLIFEELTKFYTE